MPSLPDRISFSAWQSYKNGCQMRWKLDVVDCHFEQSFGVHLDFGTSIHKSIERYKTKKDSLSIADTIIFFEKMFRELFEKNKDKYREKERTAGPEIFVSAGKRILEEFDSCEELRNAEVMFNEHEIRIPIGRTDNIKIDFKGFIDFVIKTKDVRGNTILYVIDFKTCSFGWTIDKRRDRNLHAQLFLYKHFLCKKFNLDPKNVRVAFVLLKRTPPKGSPAIEFFPVSAGPVSVQRALDDINADITDMDKRLNEGTIRHNKDMCVSKYGDKCPYNGSELCEGWKTTK